MRRSLRHPGDPDEYVHFVDSAGNWHLRVLAFTNGIVRW
jgi:hypothetical protein